MKFTVTILLASSILISGCGAHFSEHHGSDYKHQSSKHHFRDTEKYAAMFESPDRKKWQKPDEIVKKTGIKKDDRVADIGAGTGYFTRRFAAVVGPDGTAIGYDIEPGMIEYMKKDAGKLKLKNYMAKLVNPDEPDLPEKYFDLIFLNNTYHHISNRPEYFSRLKKTLRNNGKIVIVDFYKRESPYGPPKEMKLTKESVIGEMKIAGYRLTRFLDFLPHQYFLEFR